MHDSLSEYLDLLKGQNKAEGTVQLYSRGIVLFSEWLEAEGIEPEAVTTRDVQRYLSWLKAEKGYAPKTIRGYFTAVSNYFGDLKNTGAVEKDPSEAVVVSEYAKEETIKEQETKNKRTWLTEEQLESVTNNVPSPTIRNRLLVLFQYFTGLRRQEVVDVKLDDIDREERKVQVRGKGNKINTTYWKPELDGLLIRWLDKGYRDASPYAAESPYLFVSESAPSVSGDRLNKIVV